MKTEFLKNKYNTPQYFIIDATNKYVGRLATEVSLLLRGKYDIRYTPHLNNNNFIIIINANKIKISGNKLKQKLYYRNSQRPGSLKQETYNKLLTRFPAKILEQAIWGMLPKNKLNNQHYKQLYILNNNLNFLTN